MGRAETYAEQTVKQRGFSQGNRVVLRGLPVHPQKGTPKLEGAAGTVRAWLPKEERWEVLVDGRHDPVAVDPRHLVMECLAGADLAKGATIVQADEGSPRIAKNATALQRHQQKETSPGDLVEVFYEGTWAEATVLEKSGDCPPDYVPVVRLDDCLEVIVPPSHLRRKDTFQLVKRRLAACALAREKLTKRSVTKEDVLQVLRKWPFLPNSLRTNVIPEGQSWVLSDTFGLVNGRGAARCVETRLAMDYPDIMRLMSQWLRDTSPKFEQAFPFTSVNLNCSYAARVHRDKRNAGPSLLRALGEFTGGRLGYFPEDNHSLSLDELPRNRMVYYDTHRRWRLIDGNRAHCVEDFVGERYSVVFFTCRTYGQASKDLRRALVNCGAIWPSKASMKLFEDKLPPARGYEHRRVRSVKSEYASPPRSRRRGRSSEEGSTRGRSCGVERSPPRDPGSGVKRGRSPHFGHRGQPDGCAKHAMHEPHAIRPRWASLTPERQVPRGMGGSGGKHESERSRRTTSDDASKQEAMGTSRVKNYKVLRLPHLCLGLKIGEIYSSKRLVKSCKGDRGKLAALRTKLMDPQTFEPVD